MKAIIEINGKRVIRPDSLQGRRDRKVAEARGNIVHLSTKGKNYEEFKNEFTKVMSQEYGIFYTETSILFILQKFFPEHIKEKYEKITPKIWTEMYSDGSSPIRAGCRVWKKFTGNLEKDIEIYRNMDVMEKMFVTNPDATICTGIYEVK